MRKESDGSLWGNTTENGNKRVRFKVVSGSLTIFFAQKAHLICVLAHYHTNGFIKISNASLHADVGRITLFVCRNRIRASKLLMLSFAA